MNGAFLVFAVRDVLFDVLVSNTGTATTAVDDQQILLALCKLRLRPIIYHDANNYQQEFEYN